MPSTELYVIAENIRHTLYYHRRGSGRSGFASRRRLDRSSVPLSPVLPELVTNPRSAVGATKVLPAPSNCTVLLGRERPRRAICMHCRSEAEPRWYYSGQLPSSACRVVRMLHDARRLKRARRRRNQEKRLINNAAG
jgi:hypothetical protein